LAEENICKFISPYAAEELRTSCFVLETNRDVICSTYTLKLHRMILCIQGSGVFRIGAQSIPFSSGTIVFGFAGESITAECDQDIAYIYIDFSGMRAEELFRRLGIGGKNRSFAGFDGLIPLWNESLVRASVQNIDLAAEGILLYTFSRFSVKHSPQNGSVFPARSMYW